MDGGLYIAASGMVAEQVRQDQIASDLANSSTPGYKAERSSQESFEQHLLQDRSTGNSIGSIDFGVRIDAVDLDMTQGPLKQTNEPLDLALDGEGFFKIKTSNGDAYTRDGQLMVDAKGELETLQGNLVLGDGGKAIVVGTGTVSIGATGAVTVDGKSAGNIAVVSLTKPVRLGETLFSGTEGKRPAGTAVRQGYIEESAADPIRAMVSMITSYRAMESGQRVIHAIDETLSRGIDSSGASNG
jgi:flagellar basal-body rod protein FlgG